MTDAVLERLQSIGGTVTEDELRYSCAKRGIELNGDLDDLVAKGLVEKVGSGFQAVVPRRAEKPQGRRWSDEELLDRVRLWALIIGRPPTYATWDPSRLDRDLASQLTKLRKRAELRQGLRDIYAAGDWPSASQIDRRFGSLNAALAIVDFEVRSRGGQPSELREFTRSGPPAVREAVLDLDRAREAGDRDELRTALYELAISAMTEADALLRNQATEEDK